MERETFQFSPMRPILLLICIPGVFGIIASTNSYSWLNYPGTWIGVIFFLLIIWKHIRVTFLMLTLRPAVILTDKSITITDRNYCINWTDVSDVFLASVGGETSNKSYYIVIKVREPEKYLKQIKNPFTRWFRWQTRNVRLSPFEVNLSLVRGDEDELYHIVLRYFQNNRGF